jgi:hypothetical protein
MLSSSCARTSFPLLSLRSLTMPTLTRDAGRLGSLFPMSTLSCQVVQTWLLGRVRIVKHVSGPLNAQGCDVAIEELTLAYERLELE